MMIPPSNGRVPRHTNPKVNQKIRFHTFENIAAFAEMDDVTIQRRLEELDGEWDTERVLEANAASFALAGALLSFTDRRWLLLPLAVTGFLIQHALQGWCPPLAIIRRMGVRTRAEIDQEKYALKALRGDFRPLETPGTSRAVTAFRAVES